MRSLLAGLTGLSLCCTVFAEPPRAAAPVQTRAEVENLEESDSATRGDVRNIVSEIIRNREAIRLSADGSVSGGPGTLMLVITPGTDNAVDSTWTFSGSSIATVAPGNTPLFDNTAAADLADSDTWQGTGVDMTSAAAVNDLEAAILSGSATMTITSAGTFDIVLTYLDVDPSPTEDDIGVALDSPADVNFVNGDVISWSGSVLTAIPYESYNPGTFLFSDYGSVAAATRATLPLTVVVPAQSGACCINAATCTDNLLATECFDAGGVWQGAASTCADAQAAGFCVDAPPCPPNGIIDNDGAACGQPAPDNNNAGCASPSNAFQNLGGDGCGVAVCGRSSADSRNASNRDTDWYLFTPLETTEYTACVTAQFFPQVQFWPLNPGIDPCLGVVPGIGASGNPGELVCATACLLGGNSAAVRVTTVDANGDPQRIGIGCVAYLLEISCDECVAGACCMPNNTCVTDVAEIECLANGGEYQGDDTNCVGVSCGGACCNQDGSCSDSVSKQNCINAGGSYNGQGSLCADAICPECSFEDPNDMDGLSGMDEDCTILGVDLVNSGCVSGGPGNLFSSIQCNETICGITAFDGGTRDLDYYHFIIAEETEVLVELENQMAVGNPLQFRFRWRDPTDPVSPFCSANAYNIFDTAAGDGLPPGSTFYSLVLAPARYNVGVFYDFTNDTALPPECPNGGRYRLTITCNDTCLFTCASTENEPDCGENNQINAGCSVTPVGGFSPMTVGNAVCGTTRLITNLDGMGIPTTATRDTDWWLIDIPSDGDYVINFQAEFEALFLMRRVGSPIDCTTPLIASLQIFQCGDVSFTITGLTAGQHAIFVAPDFNSYSRFNEGVQAGEACGSAYSLEVVGDVGGCPSVCGDANCDGSVTVSDIGFFVTAVAQGEAAWNAAFPGGVAPCDFCANDTNGDGFVTVSDIGPFVTAVIGGGCQ